MHLPLTGDLRTQFKALLLLLCSQFQLQYQFPRQKQFKNIKLQEWGQGGQTLYTLTCNKQQHDSLTAKDDLESNRADLGAQETDVSHKDKPQSHEAYNNSCHLYG